MHLIYVLFYFSQQKQLFNSYNFSFSGDTLQ